MQRVALPVPSKYNTLNNDVDENEGNTEEVTYAK